MGFGNVSSQKSSQATEARDYKVTGGDNSRNYGGENNVITDASPLALETVTKVVEAALGNQLNNRNADNAVITAFATGNDRTTQTLAKLAETKITDGASNTQKTVLVALAIGGAVLLLPSVLKR